MREKNVAHTMKDDTMRDRVGWLCVCGEETVGVRLFESRGGSEGLE